MTVEQMIAELQKQPPKAVISINSTDKQHFDFIPDAMLYNETDNKLYIVVNEQ